MQKELLPLGQAIGLFIAPHVQQFQGADLKVGTQADIQSDNILLRQRLLLQCLKAKVVLVDQVRVFGTCRPYLCAPVADVNQGKLGASVMDAFLRNDLGLLRAFYKHIHAHDFFILRFGGDHHGVSLQVADGRCAGLVRHQGPGTYLGCFSKIGNNSLGELRGIDRRPGAVTEVAGMHALLQGIQQGIFNNGRVLQQAHMAQHGQAAEQ